MNFFSDPPALSWYTWLSRRLLSNPKAPTLISITPKEIRPCMDCLPTLAKKTRANLYTNFLSKYFTINVQTYVYPEIFESLGDDLIGAELCDKNGELIGVVFSMYVGIINNTPAGLINWLCVRPDMRKKGVTDCLLNSIQTFAYPRTIHLFRNDGWLKSPLPPLWTDTRIYRKRVLRMTTAVVKVPLEQKRSIIYEAWKKAHPMGLIFDDPSRKNSLVEVWEYKSNGTLLVLQQTFENTLSTNCRWCEIIFWSCNNSYAGTLSIEAIIDALPYDWIEAPSTLPNLGNWTSGGQSSWCIHGLDPGCPVLRPVLSLLAN
jgi:hypothetical protein